MYVLKNIEAYYVLLIRRMITDSLILPSEKVLMESLTAEQMVLVAKWVSSEIELRKDEGYHAHVSESLGAMSQRLKGLAYLKQYQTALIAR